MIEAQSNPEHNLFIRQARQISMQEAVKNLSQHAEKADAVNTQLLKAQTLWSNFVHSHGLSSEVFNCTTKLFPVMFPDSEVAKLWGEPNKGMNRNKGDYFATDGIHPFLMEETFKALRKGEFSLDFDESSVLQTSQLNINVSFWMDTYQTVVKRNLTSIPFQKGTTAEEFRDEVFGFLDRHLIPKQNCVSITTDGCSTMLGKDSGVQKIMRDEIPHLPDFGGCVDHDISNSIKSAVKKLSCPINKLYHAMPTYIASQSLHRFRDFQQVCKDIGLNPQNPPKMFEVRFKVIPILAKWMEKNDRGLYTFIKGKLSNLREEKQTDTEKVIKEIYLEQYVEVRLTNKFLLDVTEDLLEFLYCFESDEPKVHVRFEKTVLLLFNYACKFLVNGGLSDETDVVNAKHVLTVDYSDEDLQLSNSKIFLGERVDTFLKDIKIERNDPILAKWLAGVKEFYIELYRKFIKYYGTSLKSKTLEYCSVLSPKSVKSEKLDNLGKKWKYLASKFPTLVHPTKVPAVAIEAQLLKTITLPETLVKPVDYINALGKYVDLDNNQISMFPLLTRLGKGLLTIYNSSAAAERDFSLQNFLFSDKRKNSTGQLRLQARLNMKSNVLCLRNKCCECNEGKQMSDKTEDDLEHSDELGGTVAKKHCHCSLFEITDELLLAMSNGKPHKSYAFRSKQLCEENKRLRETEALERELDDDVAKSELTLEVKKWRTSFNRIGRTNLNKTVNDLKRKATNNNEKNKKKKV